MIIACPQEFPAPLMDWLAGNPGVVIVESEPNRPHRVRDATFDEDLACIRSR